MKVSSLRVLNHFFVGIVLITAKEIFAASCGGGNRGDGVCSNGSCCSKWGWCVTHSESCGYFNSYQPSVFPTLAPTAITVERMTDVRKLKFNMTLATSKSGTIDTKEFSGIMETHLQILLQENLQQWPKGDVNYDAVVVTLNAFVVMAEERPFRDLSSIAKEAFKTHIHALGRAILPANTPMLFLNEVPAMIASAFDEEKRDEFLKRLHDAKDPILRSSIQVWKGFSDSQYNYMLSNHSPSPSLVAETKDTSVTNYTSSTSGYDKKVEKKEKLPLDYTVFGIVVLTLSMLLIVEVLRHSLDVKASGNLFFETVLELMYRELTTLGVVEFILYLMHKYHPNFNYSLEAVFIDVHFLLSYTAIFNAIQSVFLRLITSRRVEKAWVHTENVEISHYVAIRKEFELVERKLNQLRYNHDDRISIYSETETHDGRFSTRTKFSNWSQRIRHPNLTRRKYKLLVPIRFHELRVHLIAQNNLPRKFKVSYYLKSSLTNTLLEFVHISFFAWIMLMMTVNLIYFASGIIMTFSKSQSTLSEFLVGTFIGIMTLFWVLALLLFFKMKETFEHILTMRLPNENTHRGRRNSQLSLFWGGNPRFVIILTQYMQFGFALGLAGCVTYWKELMSFSYAHMNLSWMLLVVVASYVIFQPLLADILEWYTLCTNMGQLVNMERLHKALAKHKMDEEIRKQKSREEEKTIEDAISRNLRGKREFDRTIDNDIGVSALSLSELVKMPTKDLPEIQLHETNVQHLVRFFEGYRYQTLSLLIGPMACFFFIGMRIQGFAVAEGIISNDLNKFQLSLSTTFWLETACYCWMTVELFITLAVFVRNGNRQGILAATLGMILNIICLSLLMIAEAMRCCSNKGFGELSYMAFAEHTAGCCSNFGERTYGGLGHVEPFTSLIALSPFRYLVAGIIFPLRLGPNHEHKPNNDSSHHGSDSIDRSRALWYATVATHSDLAEKYGMFSSQILCAMLGIEMPVPKSQETCIDRSSDSKDSKCAMEKSTQSQCSQGDVSARSTPDNSPRDSPPTALENDNFDYPAARLVLDVCRCECKLLPLLEEWILVDVMLTSHELVICGVRSGECSPDAVVEVLRESIGMRLRDVAKGRSIVSQFSLDDIDNINIEQRLSVLAGEKFDDYESNHPGGRDSNDELDLSEHSIYVNESHLKIHFTNGCGTVLLRFLADMNEEKRNLCNWLLADVGTQAKLWCQTIARLRGETNLRMTRSHFHGKGGIDESEDYIQVRETHGKKQRKSIHERWEHRRTTRMNRLSNLKGLRGSKFT